MARGRTKRNYKRNYNGFKRYRQVASRNYFKVKAEFYDVVRFPTGTAGQLVFASRSGQELPANRSVIPIASIYTNYTYSNILSGLFSYYKLLSVAVELVPKYNNGDVVADQEQCFLGFRMGNNGALTMSELKALNQSILLDARNRQRRYWRVYNTSGDWINTNDALLGGFTVQASANALKDAQHAWDIKFSIYLLYKYSKA